MTERSATRARQFRKVIARAKPACHICGKTIDYALPYSDPLCFVVDHVIPLHRGGPDSIQNAAAAHRECNSKKRARLIAPIVRRSGSLD